MRYPGAATRHLAAFVVLGLLAGACTDGDDGDTGPGVTAQACPDAVNEDNGCIYLGIIADLTQGPDAAVWAEAVEGQRDFWQRVNDEGGIGGYDVDVDTHTRDDEATPQGHAEAYSEIEPEVLALAQVMASPPAEEILEELDQDDMVGVPGTAWSGWDFDEVDEGLLLSSGISHCLGAQVGLDWLAEDAGGIESVLAIGYPGDHGGDAAAGVQAWTEEHGAEYLGFTGTQPNPVGGDQDGAVQVVLTAAPDVVHLGTGAAEAGEIVVGAARRGFDGMFLGTAPTWHPALGRDPEVAQILASQYRHVGPWEPFDGDSDAHEAMRAVHGEDPPANDGYTAGWMRAYPLRALLDAAAAEGDLTREGLRDAVDGLEVDYEGALESRTYGGDGADDAPRSAVISAPDVDAPLGLRTLATDVRGPTADAYDYAAPCEEAP
jgi:ABC-type branched-subunit amino acid transport system substrate-binding protein